MEGGVREAWMGCERGVDGVRMGECERGWVGGYSVYIWREGHVR